MLSRRFPFLLLCDSGAWKINELIKQMYHSFKGSQAKHSKAAPASVKAETMDSNGPFNVPVGSKKRERQGSLLSLEGSPVPAKSARRSAPPPEHANTDTEPLQYTTSPPLSVSRGPCETTAPTRLLLVGTAPSPSLAPSADLDPPLTVPTTCPEDNSTTATTQVFVDGRSEAAASTGEAAPPPGTGIIKTDHAIVPVRKPFSTQTPRRSLRLMAGDPPTAGTHIPGPVPQVATTTQVSDLNIGATECSNPGMGTSSIAGAITTATSSKGRPHKGTAVKAAMRYKPDVISDKNLFMRRMVERDPEVLYTDVLTAFDNLMSEELEACEALSHSTQAGLFSGVATEEGKQDLKLM
ncbi:hypothetical protein C2E23DRAFT_890022 [Lenzites betulinus]|nr:hypothetical protein C2E23DRAFT_890022 [Lenzites betulinus]